MVAALNSRVLQILLCAVLLLCFAPGLSAAVSAQLSAQNIDELETVRLSIKITETRQSETLDLSALEADFHVLNTNTISQSRFLNGRGHSWVDYQITLQPKRTGTLTIPSISVGSEQTPTLELRVRPLSNQTRQLIDELVFFETAVSEPSIYVQSELVLTRRLYYSQGVQLYSDLPGAPEIADAVVLTLGETRSSTIERDGRPYGVVEQRYAIFPERSGSFTIPAISITASVRLVENDRVSRKGVRVGTEAQTIEVLPVPAEYPADEPWLPAKNVTLFDVVNPELSTHDVGDTLTHELLVYVEGNIGTMVPPAALKVDEDNFRVYPQAPDIRDDTTGGSVKGTRLQTHSLVPLNPGQLRLPVTQIVWWDTQNRKVRVAATKPRTLGVTGEAVNVPVPVERQRDVDNAAETSGDTIAGPQRWDWRPLLPYAAALTLLLALILLTRLLRPRISVPGWRRSNTRNLQAARKALLAATQRDDNAQLHQSLLAYLSEVYGLPKAQALIRFRKTTPQVAAAIDALLRHLYGSGGDFSAQQRTLLRSAALEQHRDASPGKAEALPELYPQTST